MSSSEWLVDGIFPTHLVHILAGASGSNKTTYLLQTLPKWAKGEPIHGRESHPVPWIFISCDRSWKETRHTFDRMGIPYDSIRTVCMMDKKYRDILTVEVLFERMKKEHPDVRLYVIDAFYTLTPDGRYNDNATVNKFLRTLVKLCEENDVTVIGTHHSPKMKEGEGYVASRDCILGAIAWGAFASTILHIRSPEPDNDECRERYLAILARNGAAITQDYVLDNSGLLQPVAPKRKDGPYNQLREFIHGLKLEEEFDSQEAVAAAGASRQHVHKMLMSLAREGMIERVDRGTYKRSKSATEAFFSQTVQ